MKLFEWVTGGTGLLFWGIVSFAMVNMQMLL
jgi:hypothetical protein